MLLPAGSQANDIDAGINLLSDFISAVPCMCVFSCLKYFVVQRFYLLAPHVVNANINHALFAQCIFNGGLVLKRVRITN